MFLLFSFSFMGLFLFFFFLGIFLMDYISFVVDFISPFSSFVDFSMSFYFDYVSFFFFSVVSLISSMVFLYSKFYMSETNNFNSDNSRFFFLLFLFVVSMFFLVFSGSWVVVMLGWDGLGLSSFLLVVYYNNSSSLDSGLITVFTNRVGDCFFIVSFIFMVYCGWASFDFLALFGFSFFVFVIFLGAITKSAQYPFSSWLPAAMAAPTPVSSLVHSSTLVTAGVFLLIRFNYLLSFFSFYISLISLFTMCLAGLCALYELDFKKVVAMSTLSQLGFMIFAISSGYWVLSLLHMIFHAFFKSSLFLATGGLMHLFMGDQDSRYFGSLGSSFFSKVLFFMSCLNLCGFPFSLGFFSKDCLISSFSFFHFNFFSFLFLLGCCLTVAYSLRLVYMSFFNFSSSFSFFSFLEELFFYFPLFFLYVGCIFLGNFYFFNFLPPLVFSFLDLFLGSVIIFFGYLLFCGVPYFYYLTYLTSTIFFLSVLSSSFFSSFSLFFSFTIDYSWTEILGCKGVSFLFSKGSHTLRRLQGLNFLPFLIFIMFFLGLNK